MSHTRSNQSTHTEHKLDEGDTTKAPYSFSRFRISRLFSSQNKKRGVGIVTMMLMMTGLGASVLLTQQSQDIRQQAYEPNKTGVVLRLVPNQISLQPGSEVKIDVLVDTNSLQASAFKLRINYPRDQFEPVRIEPAAGLTDVLTPAYTGIDYTTITLGSGLQNTIIGQRAVAHLTLKAKQASGSYSVSIDPTTEIAARFYTSNVLERVENAAISIINPSPSSTPTPSPTPNPSPSLSPTPRPSPTPSPTISSGNNGPTITVKSPMDGGRFPTRRGLYIGATATDSDGIALIEFYFNGRLIKSCPRTTKCDFTYREPYENIPSGINYVTINAYDRANPRNLSSVTMRVIK